MNNNTNNILIDDKIELDKSNIIINKRMLNEGELLKVLQNHKSVFQVLKSYNKNNENKYIGLHILANTLQIKLRLLRVGNLEIYTKSLRMIL